MGQKDATLGILTDKVGRLACSKCGEELDVSEYSIFEHVLCPVCQHEISVPAKLGNFLLIDEIGKGGMGAVYLAKDESLGREVALKVMRQEYGSDPRFLDRLLKEAQAAASLNHPNVVQVYTFGQEMGQPYIVMELVNGGRLDLHMKNNAQVDELIVLDTAVEVAKGLQAAADAGLIHGDIKPANILYDRQNHAKVVDFGLAKFEGAGKTPTKGEIWGTPYYIAPEKARGKSEDFRSDQYSLGATLYHALTGKPPFDGETAADVVVARLKNPAPDPRQLNAKLSDRTAAIVLRMMDQTPAKRYPTYPSLLADLQESRTALLAARQQQKQQQAQSRGKAAKSGPNLVVVVGAVVVVAAIGIGIAVSQGGKKDGGAAVPPVVTPAVPSDFWTKHQPSDASPFGRAESVALIDAVRVITDAIRKGEAPRSISAQSKLGQVMRKYPEGTPAHAWCQLMQVMVHVLANESDLAKDVLKDLLNARINYVGAPVADPRILAKMIAGQVDYTAAKANTRSEPEWFRQLVDFFGAFRMVLAGEAGQVTAVLGAYNQAPHDQFWPYAFQDYGRLLSGQADEMLRIIGDKDEARRAKALGDFSSRHPIWRPAIRKLAGEVKVSRAGRPYPDIIRQLKPQVYYRLNDTSPGKLKPEVDADQSAAATYVVADGLGRSDRRLDAAAGFDADNRHLTMAERNSFDFVNNLVTGGKLSSKAGTAVLWFRCAPADKGDREMLFARGSDNTPVRLRLRADGRPEFSAGDNGSVARVSVDRDAADGQWHQLALVWDAAASSAEIVLDGELRASTRYAPADFQFSLVRFGRNDQTGGQFRGDLDELALWNRALSGPDLSQLTAR